MHEGPVTDWATKEFGRAPLGDSRRTKRVVKMTVAAASRPSGRVSEVFNRAADREGAYDFLENPRVNADALAASMVKATAERARAMDGVYVDVDGSALSLSDENGSKGFGPVGSPNAPVKGLKVMNAHAIARDGVPLGLIDQLFWNRPPTDEGLTSAQRTERNRLRSFDEKETSYFVRAAENAVERLARENVRAWVVIDREADIATSFSDCTRPAASSPFAGAKIESSSERVDSRSSICSTRNRAWAHTTLMSAAPVGARRDGQLSTCERPSSRCASAPAVLVRKPTDSGSTPCACAG